MKSLITMAFVANALFCHQPDNINVPGKKSFNVNIRIEDATEKDTLHMLLYKLNFFVAPEEVTATLNKDSLFCFNISTEERNGYFQILKNRVKKPRPNALYFNLTHQYFWEQGDSIFMEIVPKESVVGANSEALFYGNGSGKYKMWYDLQHERRKFTPSAEPEFSGNLLDNSTLQLLNKVTSPKLSYLELHRGSMSPLSYQVLRTDLEASEMSSRINRALHYYQETLADSSETIKNQFRQAFRKYFFPLATFNTSAEVRCISTSYQEYLGKLFRSAVLIASNSFSPSEVFSCIDRETEGLVRQLAYLILLTDQGVKPELKPWYERALSITDNKHLRSLLLGLESLYEFDLTKYSFLGERGDTLSISDFSGKYILLDFWGVGCGGCAAYYKDVLKPASERLHSQPGLAVLSVNIDRDRKSWKRGMESGLFTDNKAINVSLLNSKSFLRPILKDLSISAIPSVLFIGKDGRLISICRSNAGIITMRSELKNFLENVIQN